MKQLHIGLGLRFTRCRLLKACNNRTCVPAAVQPVREHLVVGVAAVHQRVGAQRPAALQHPRHHQGTAPRCLN